MASLSTPSACFSPLPFSLLSPPMIYSYSLTPQIDDPFLMSESPLGQPTERESLPMADSESHHRMILAEMEAIERANALQSTISSEVQIIESSLPNPSVDVEPTIEPPRIIPPLEIKGKHVCNVDEQCHLSYTRKYDLKIHIMMNHGVEALKLRPDLKSKVTKLGRAFACPLQTCLSGYSRMSDLKKHMLGMHGDLGVRMLQSHLEGKKTEKPFPCPHEDCKSGYSTIYDLKNHVKRIHQEELVPEKKILEQIFKCQHQECQLLFKEAQELKIHLWDIHSEIVTTKTVVDQFKKHSDEHAVRR